MPTISLPLFAMVLQRVLCLTIPEFLAALADDADRGRGTKLKIVLRIQGTGSLQLICRCAVLLATAPCRLVSMEVQQCPPDLWLAMAEALKVNTSLLSFATSGHLEEDVAVALAAVLHQNRHLRSFFVKRQRGQSVEDPAAVAFAQALRQNVTLHTFAIGGEFGDEGGIALAHALRQHRSLRSFAINGNFGDNAVSAFAEILRQQSSLHSFCIRCAFHCIAGIALARALEQNKTLRIFSANCRRGWHQDGQFQTDQLCEVFARAMSHNNTLRAFSLNFGLGMGTGIASFPALCEIFSRNIALLHCNVSTGFTLSGHKYVVPTMGICARNFELRRTYAALRALAHRKISNPDWLGWLPNVRCFEAIFAFLLPDGCIWPFVTQV